MLAILLSLLAYITIPCFFLASFACSSSSACAQSPYSFCVTSSCFNLLCVQHLSWGRSCLSIQLAFCHSPVTFCLPQWTIFGVWGGCPARSDCCPGYLGSSEKSAMGTLHADPWTGQKSAFPQSRTVILLVVLLSLLTHYCHLCIISTAINLFLPNWLFFVHQLALPACWSSRKMLPQLAHWSLVMWSYLQPTP